MLAEERVDKTDRVGHNPLQFVVDGGKFRLRLRRGLGGGGVDTGVKAGRAGTKGIMEVTPERRKDRSRDVGWKRGLPAGRGRRGWRRTGWG